jgi:hypothetical protein
MLTRNTDKLRQEVTAHVAADSIVQGTYWNTEDNKGCFIGCLAKGDNPAINEVTYGLPVMVQRIAENIFEALFADEAKAFFAALPDAVSCDGKDLSKVGWQFLAAELRSLPDQSAEIQAVVDPVIAGIDLLASGQKWAAAAAADAAAANAAAIVAAAAADAAAANAAAIVAAADAAWAAADAAARVAWSAIAAAAWAADAAADAAWAAAARAAAWADAAWADAARAARLRQRDLLLRLISEAPVVEVSRG